MHKNTNHFLDKKYAFIALICLAVACTTANEKAPISSQVMKSLLLDLHYAEAYSSLIVSDSIQKKEFNKNTDSLVVFYKEIFDKHHITATQFDAALKWYSLHPGRLDSIYRQVMPVLDSLKTIPEKDSTQK